jgi:hypothetical protein
VQFATHLFARQRLRWVDHGYLDSLAERVRRYIRRRREDQSSSLLLLFRPDVDLVDSTRQRFRSISGGVVATDP